MFIPVHLLFLVGLFSNALATTPEADADEVKNLPGSSGLNLPFKQYSGYLSIPGLTGSLTKHMHYWFVQSANSPASDPLTFWTNGGPGCSGLLGFLTEQGPFKPNADMTLTVNEYAWNRIANMVFIESPAGVGFSYSDDKNDYTTGDSQTALDNYNLIQAFLTRFPELRSNDLYISSESYGGHYMPTLAKQIVDSNQIATNTHLNFKGFAVGNPYTDPYSGTPAMIDTYWGHQLIAAPQYSKYTKMCKDTAEPNTAACAALAIQMSNGVGNLNPYALDYPVCTSANKGSAEGLWQLNHQLKLAGVDPKSVGIRSTESYQPCEEDYAATYLNQASVKAALHVKGTIQWDMCSNKLKYNTTDSSSVSTAPIYNYLINGGFKLNILVFSGDDDAICGTVGTQSWIWDLGYEVAGRSWQTYTYNQQVAGYFTAWKNTKLGFLTIHGAGHEVPAYKPDVAFDMFKRYLAGEFTSA